MEETEITATTAVVALFNDKSDALLIADTGVSVPTEELSKETLDVLSEIEKEFKTDKRVDEIQTSIKNRWSANSKKEHSLASYRIKRLASEKGVNVYGMKGYTSLFKNGEDKNKCNVYKFRIGLEEHTAAVIFCGPVVATFKADYQIWKKRTKIPNVNSFLNMIQLCLQSKRWEIVRLFDREFDETEMQAFIKLGNNVGSHALVVVMGPTRYNPNSNREISAFHVQPDGYEPINQFKTVGIGEQRSSDYLEGVLTDRDVVELEKIREWGRKAIEKAYQSQKNAIVRVVTGFIGVRHFEFCNNIPKGFIFHGTGPFEKTPFDENDMDRYDKFRRRIIGFIQRLCGCVNNGRNKNSVNRGKKCPSSPGSEKVPLVLKALPLFSV